MTYYPKVGGAYLQFNVLPVGEINFKFQIVCKHRSYSCVSKRNFSMYANILQVIRILRYYRFCDFACNNESCKTGRSHIKMVMSDLCNRNKTTSMRKAIKTLKSRYLVRWYRQKLYTKGTQFYFFYNSNQDGAIDLLRSPLWCLATTD